jgi:hypothetical protein
MVLTFSYRFCKDLGGRNEDLAVGWKICTVIDKIRLGDRKGIRCALNRTYKKIDGYEITREWALEEYQNKKERRDLVIPRKGVEAEAGTGNTPCI